MASKKDVNMVKWFGVIIFMCQLIFGFGMLYSQHKQLIPLVEKVNENVNRNSTQIAINSTRINVLDKEVDRLSK